MRRGIWMEHVVVECKLSEYLAQNIACAASKCGKSLSIECNGTVTANGR